MRWEMKPLGELGSLFTDGDWIETKDQSSEGIRLVQTGNIGVGVFKDRRDKARWISEETFDRLKCEEIFEGDILVSRLPDPVGRACLIPSVPDRCITGVDCAIIRLNNAVTAQFVMRFCNSTGYFKEVESLATGATRKRISRKNLGTIKVPIPPLEEQQRIVEVLDEAFAAIDKAKANIERNLTNARELFQSRLNDIFSNPSEDWEERDFGEVCEIIGGSQPPKSTFKYEPQEGYVRLVQVRDYRTEKFKTFIPKSLAKKFCDSSDIMIGRYGPPIFGIFGGLEGAYNVALMKAVPDESMVDKEYFRWFLKSRDLVRFVELTSKRAAGQDGVRKERLYAYPTPIPPMRVQRAIIEELTHLNELNIALIGAFESKLEDLEELRQSILEQAFEGKLTGPVAA